MFQPSNSFYHINFPDLLKNKVLNMHIAKEIPALPHFCDRTIMLKYMHTFKF
jgi:hypothetical protein